MDRREEKRREKHLGNKKGSIILKVERKRKKEGEGRRLKEKRGKKKGAEECKVTDQPSGHIYQQD